MTNRDIVRVGERVNIATMTAGDQPLFRQWLSENEELRCLIADKTVPSLEDQNKWFERSLQSDRKFYSIVTKDGILIGNGGFVDIAGDAAQLRITIGNPAFIGQGYGTEAIKLILREGFEQLGFKSVYLHVLPENGRAIHVYEKVGFKKVKDYVAKSGKNKVLMGIDRVHFNI